MPKSRHESYRVLVAALTGVGFTAVLCLVLRVHLLIAVFLFPAVLFLPSAWAVMAANAVIYSVAAYYIFRNKSLSGSRRMALGLILPVLLLSSFACLPKFNVLLPAGMCDLAEQEQELSREIPEGTSVEQARSILKSKNIAFGERIESSASTVLER